LDAAKLQVDTEAEVRHTSLIEKFR